MNDMSAVIAPKSDQLNSDDLIAGPRTITVREVNIRPGTEQPVAISYEGDNGKPWKPCKSTSRILVAAWGPDASKYAGRSVTLYRDADVKWGGMAVGGIRISHVSHIERPLVMALTEKKGSKKLTTIQPLKVEAKEDAAAKWADGFIAELEGLRTADAIAAHEANNAKGLKRLEDQRPELRARIQAAVKARFDLISASSGGAASHDTPATEDMGEGE